ncbi:MAG: damage-inducible protein DinB [Comamonadaceae bacterium]|nr:MAG: damage-inducible protein DinB [Comamonadaceae bacterium]
MSFCDNYRLMARYNRWINQRVYEAAGRLTEEERQRDRGAFFGSIHRTLQHLVVADQIWLKRFIPCADQSGIDSGMLGSDVLDLPTPSALDMLLFADWAPLLRKRVQLDAAIDEWTAGFSDAFLNSTMRYGNSKGVQRAHPAWQALTHFFNHQTHHRGQATTLLAQAGVDLGVTDLVALL